MDYAGDIKWTTRGIQKAVVVATNLESFTGIPQTKLVLHQFFDTRAWISHKLLVKSNAPQCLNMVKDIKFHFEQNQAIDTAEHAVMTNLIRNVPQVYTPEEQISISDGKSFMCRTTSNEGTSISFVSSDPLVAMKGVFYGGEALGTGIATTIMDATAEEVISSVYCDLYSRKLEASPSSSYIIELKSKCLNDHSLLYLTERKLPIPGFSPREAPTKATWWRDQDGSAGMDVSITDEGEDLLPHKPGNVRMVVHTVWTCTPLPDIGGLPQTAVKLATKVDLAGVVPAFLMNKLGTGFLSMTSRLRQRFDRSHEVDVMKRTEIITRMTALRKSEPKNPNDSLQDKNSLRKVRKHFAPIWMQVEGRGKVVGR